MKLFYRKSGSGPALVILHGLYGSSDNWVSIGRNLEDVFTVIIPDLRNHGQSPHSGIHNYKSMAHDIKELAWDLNIGKMYLAGHSMGGKCAMEFSALFGEMVAGLLVADIAPVTETGRKLKAARDHLEIMNAMQSIDPYNFKRRDDIDNILAQSINDKAIREFILKNLSRLPEGGFEWKINIQSLVANIDELTGTPGALDNPEEQITGFPVIFLRGERSDYIQDDDILWIKKIFPAADIIKVPGAGHWLHADNPELVIKAIRSLAGY